MQSTSKFITGIAPNFAKTALQLTTTFTKNSATPNKIGVENIKLKETNKSKRINMTENIGKTTKLLIIENGTSLNEQSPIIGKMPIVALIVIEKEDDKNFGNFNLSKMFSNNLESNMIAKTAPKENKNPTSNKYNG